MLYCNWFDKDWLNKDLYFMPNWATNDEVFNILEFSFYYLVEKREEMIGRFWWKWYWLLLAKSLQNKPCFREIPFLIPNFHIIPTDFYKFEGENPNIEFDSKQEKYLKQVFDSFSNTPYIAIRSSADIEDIWDKNYSWVFYSWFCSTNDFEHFLEEIKKVLESAWNVRNKEIWMWIVIMEVTWIKHANWDFYPDWWWVMATTNFWDRTTISSEFWLPVWITSWKNSEVITFDLEENWNVLHACIKEWDSCKMYINDEFVLSNWILKKSHNKASLTRLDNNWMVWIFSWDIYKKIVYIWKQLERFFGYSLDIEFAVNNWEIYILQIRKYPNNYTRPNNMELPNLESKEIIFSSWDIFSWLWYLNNIELNFELLRLPFIPWNSEERRMHDNRVLIDALNKLEEKYSWGSYAIYLDRLETFPNIDLRKYPWLKLVTFKSDEERYKLSHTYMMLRESWIPHIIFKDNPDLSRIVRKIWKAFVYLDWNNWLYIYK